MNEYIKKFWGHLQTVLRHKWYVFQECYKMGLIWQGIIHDLSKFHPIEFIPGVKYYQGDRSPIKAERDSIGYSYAWRHHKGRNRHHWAWYLDNDVDKDGNMIWNPAPMPEKYIKEMYCDIKAANRAYGGKGDQASILKYYLDHKHKWVLHSDTKQKFESMLGI